MRLLVRGELAANPLDHGLAGAWGADSEPQAAELAGTKLAEDAANAAVAAVAAAPGQTNLSEREGGIVVDDPDVARSIPIEKLGQDLTADVDVGISPGQVREPVTPDNCGCVDAPVIVPSAVSLGTEFSDESRPQAVPRPLIAQPRIP